MPSSKETKKARTIESPDVSVSKPNRKMKKITPTEKIPSKEVKKKVVKPESPQAKKETPLVDDDRQFVGLTRDEAMALAKKLGVPARVVSVDGEKMMMTMDYSRDRRNFTIVQGKVVKVTRG